MIGRLLRAILPVGVVVVVATAGYMAFWGWSLLDAIYMTAITVGTVGFREVRALDAGAQVFTIVVIFAGILAGSYALAQVFEILLEGQLRGLWESRRIKRRVAAMQGHTVLAGLGRVGLAVAETLAAESKQFVVVDRSDEQMEDARQRGWLSVQGDATDETTLREAGLQNASAFITALDTDAENMFAVVTARDLNPGLFIAARSSHESSEAKLRKAGADRVLTPNVIGGRRLAMMALNPTVSDYLDLVAHGSGLEYRLQEVEVVGGSALDGVTISDARVRERTGAYVLAVRRRDGQIDPNPGADTRMHGGDRLVVLGTADQVEGLSSAM
jgi:voltage-gated potassium channel